MAPESVKKVSSIRGGCTRWQLVLVLVMGAVSAGALRLLFGYPTCPGDEHSWAEIWRQVAAGVEWPISGPLFFSVLNLGVDLTGWEPEAVLAVLGMVSVPVVVSMIWFAYRLLGLRNILLVFLILATTNYFWAPLLESRPQQWGLGLVVLGLTVFLRVIYRSVDIYKLDIVQSVGSHYRPNLVGNPMVGDFDGTSARRGDGTLGSVPWLLWAFWSVLLLLTASVHLLSFALLLGLSFLLLILFAILHHDPLANKVLWVASALPGLSLLVLPDGPYAAMLLDLRVNHFPGLVGPSAVFAVAVVAFLGAAIVVPYLRTSGSWVLRHIGRFADVLDPRIVVLAATVLAIALLGAQAMMLPAEAWTPYSGSWLRFVFFQSGNVFFFFLVCLGVWHLLLRPRSVLMQEGLFGLVQLLLGFALVAVAMLIASLIMLDSNWMLRVLNYGVIVAAPIAAFGMSYSRVRMALMMLCIPFAMVSLVATLRPPSVFACI